jgi:hypothetical protein
MSQTDRREFLSKVGKVGAMAGAGALVAGSVGCSDNAVATPGQIVQWPLQYEPADEDRARELAYYNFYNGGCCYGAFEGMVAVMRELLGGDFDHIPTDMMRFGGGGVAGFGSICGTLNGAAAAINLMLPNSEANPLITELLSWYAATMLPTTETNAYAMNSPTLPEGKTQLFTGDLGQSIAGGNLCHMSVTNWSQTTGIGSGSAERKERCARLTADIAVKAFELLTKNYNGTFTAEYGLPADNVNCRTCHKEGTDPLYGEFTNGKMDCGICHIDPVESPH